MQFEINTDYEQLDKFYFLCGYWWFLQLSFQLDIRVRHIQYVIYCTMI